MTATTTLVAPGQPARDPVRTTTRRRAAGINASLLLPGALAVVLFLVVPVLILLARSFSGNPPGTAAVTPLTDRNYQQILSSAPYYGKIFGKSLLLAGLGSLIGAIVAFPLALGIVNSRSRALRFGYVFIALTPLLVSVVIRSFGWQILLGPAGPVGRLAGGTNGLLSTDTAIVIGLAHLATPFVLLALIPVVDSVDMTLVRAARSIGAGTPTVFFRVVLPLCASGVVAGWLISFTVGATVVVTPQLLGGRSNVMASNLIYDQMVTFFNWNLAAAISVLLMLAIALVAAVVTVLERRLSPWRAAGR